MYVDHCRRRLHRVADLGGASESLFGTRAKSGLRWDARRRRFGGVKSETEKEEIE